jgi:hypothetical protein
MSGLPSNQAASLETQLIPMTPEDLRRTLTNPSSRIITVDRKVERIAGLVRSHPMIRVVEADTTDPLVSEIVSLVRSESPGPLLDPDAIDRVARKFAAALGLDRGYPTLEKTIKSSSSIRHSTPSCPPCPTGLSPQRSGGRGNSYRTCRRAFPSSAPPAIG